ncbi:SWIM zinc finger family protein [Bradyrhizobium sediminis]|uniref:SWIM zinc finger family protein n=1 Tax=Bradyrhizobium sediminis TaxID=2840469 RepID=A0A975NJS1_9BRAD|nr:SWIM zinc finger family protein [Bradyrhizobium sediminis]
MRELAGGKVFARGEAYHRDGQVQILVINPERVLAQVAGSEDYRTELLGRGRAIGGECSCPAFEDHGFCKHMVATALAANDLGADEADGSGALVRIRNHLKEKGVDALVDIIVGLAEQDLALFRKLDAATAALHEDDKTLGKRLCKAIDQATQTRDFMDYHEVPRWAANVDSALDTVAGLASGARAGLACELADHAVDRIGQAIEEIDDSDGYCMALLERARDIHLAAVSEIRPEPVELARDLFAREMAEDYGTFDGAVRRYADVLGEAGLAEYRRLARKAWEKPAPSAGRKGQQDDDSVDRHQLMRILDFFAERDGDVDARIALRVRDLSSSWDYLQLAEFCLSHGRADEALRWAEEGLWKYEDGRPDVGLTMFAAELLSKAGRKADAEAHLWRLFEKSPTFDLYKRLCGIGGKAARERALSFLEGKQASGARLGWNSPIDLLARIWIDEEKFDAAWAAVGKHGASAGLKEELAGKSEATHPREVLEVYTQRVDQLVNAGGGSNYQQAAKLVARMAKLRPRGEQVAYVLGLRQRFGRRRHFTQLLE